MSKRPLAGRVGNLALVVTMAAAVLAGCSGNNEKQPAASPSSQATKDNATPSAKPYVIDTNVPAMGTSSGVFYEIFVRSFSDSNGDGIGDLQGVTNKLDYLQQLGVKGLWLMPITPSPTYHGYDVTDYYSVNPDYGTLDDAKKLVDEAHKRGIKVIIDLMLNHTSSKHPWFIDSAKNVDSKYRSWYTWAEKGSDTSALGPWGQQVWHTSAGGNSYLGVFTDGMPDLNMDNPEVRAELVKAGQFWLKLGMDGLRLDAAKHVYEDFQSSTSDPETSKKNQAWWQEFRKGMDEVNKDAYLIGEIWDSLTVVGPFLNHALNSGFNFDAAKLLIDSAKTEQAGAISSVLSKMLAYYSKQSEGQFVDAPFLSNHDQNRIMSELGENADHAKMAASLLLTMPGNPFLYYGEEIGMKGIKPDELIREPIIWAADRKSDGQTSWESTESNETTLSVEEQLQDPKSLLNHYKKLISWRNEEPTLGNGGIESFPIDESGVLGYLRVDSSSTLLVVHNLTGKATKVDLNANGTVPFSTLKHFSEEGTSLNAGQLELPPYSTVILQ
ncbi:alpha-amylase family glycosyl hydrolase [Cohnella faecalis]|uniref:Alpha-amylase n=1 Tax=Cohnella faecalis TaxID=2315694 RepID=A0A398CNQ8_9BACL|nr:alpha-amylase family glycosyl hydrolase [Cohnella faecalis]RIE02358.1 alpha-amylase [Cohnella faecalis]